MNEIAGTKTVRVPNPVCHGAGPSASWIVLEHLDLRGADERCMRALGKNLACLHRVVAGRHGWHRDSTIGATPQINTPADDWLAFWREQRGD